MRFAIVAVFALAAPLLAACSNDQPPAKPAAETPAATAPAKSTPAATAAPAAKPAPAAPAAASGTLPGDAKPLLGTWAADLASCGDGKAVTTISATGYNSPTASCDISLKAASNGDFTTTCGNTKLTLTPVFAPTGEGINIVVGDAKRQTILRCSR